VAFDKPRGLCAATGVQNFADAVTALARRPAETGVLS
jgi:hypothetical protein